MTGRSPRWVSQLAALSSILFGASVLVVACSTDDRNPTSPPMTTNGSGGSVGNGGAAAELCEDGDVRECKVDFDENNCFVGEQTCVGNEWGPCEDGTGTLALGGNAPCPSNPCNPGCQEYDENPGTPLSPPASTPPGSAVGDPTSLSTTWQDAAFNDNNHAYGSDCSSSGSCQLDHYCDPGPSPKNCLPHPDSDFDPAINWDLTIKMVCDPDTVVVCNRGGTTAPSGLAVTVWEDVISHLDPTGGAICGGMLNSDYHGSCLTTQTIAPGDCIDVTGCGAHFLQGGGGIKTVYVNGSDQAGAPWNLPYDGTEEECANNWSIYDPTASCSCSSVTQQGSLQPVDMYVFLDSSGSMNSSNPDKWVEARDSLQTFFAATSADSLNIALRMYGDTPVSGCDNSSCSSAACSSPEIPLGPLGPGVSATETAAISAINMASAPGGNGTPHEPVLGGMALWGEAQAMAEPTHIVATLYVTDGDYGGCNTNTTNNVIPIANAYANEGVLTYIVALPGISNTVYNDFVVEVATAGGTTPIDLRSSGANIGTDLTNALVSIQNALASCNITIPNPNDVDPTMIAAEYLPNGMAPGTMLTQVTNAAACSGGNQFYLDNNTTPTEVILCPTLCGTVQADANGIVDIVGACLLSTSTTLVTFDYEGSCPGGQGPQWTFLEYDTSITGNATVDFNVGSGNSVAEAQAAPDVFVAQANLANPDAPGGSPADLGGALGPNAQFATHLQLRMTMTPDGAAIPFVNNWKVSYTCVDNI